MHRLHGPVKAVYASCLSVHATSARVGNRSFRSQWDAIMNLIRVRCFEIRAFKAAFPRESRKGLRCENSFRRASQGILIACFGKPDTCSNATHSITFVFCGVARWHYHSEFEGSSVSCEIQSSSVLLRTNIPVPPIDRQGRKIAVTIVGRNVAKICIRTRHGFANWPAMTAILQRTTLR